MPDGFYVEVWQPDGKQAEQHAAMDTFPSVIAWLQDRLAEDRGRIARIRGHLSDEQRAALAELAELGATIEAV